jgi:hypothetical protein
MSAEIIEEQENMELELQEGEVAGDLLADNPEEGRIEDESGAEVAPVASTEVLEEPVEADLPEKYRGKSAAEIAEMHENLEKKLREQGNELGNIRQTLDAIALQKSKPDEPEPEPITEADFFSDPTTTVNRAIEQHPTIKQAQDMARNMALAQARAQLEQKHPDMTEIMQDPAFGEWISASSSRTARLQRAHVHGDVAEADDLFSTWKQLREVTATAQEVGKKAQKQAVRNASTGAVRGNSDSGRSRRIYRSHDLIELHKNDPKKYEAMSDEIARAYAEGRVRR